MRDRVNLQQAVHQASHNLAANYRNLARYYQQYLAYKENRAAAEINLDVQFQQYQAGMDTLFLNVLQAITEWGNAVRAEAQALLEYNTELASLSRQTGTILEAHNVRFVEERYASIGPLGRVARPRFYPRDTRPTRNADIYPTTDAPAEDAFNLVAPHVGSRKDQDGNLRVPNLERIPKPDPRRGRGRATLASLSQTRILTVPIAMVWNTSEWWPSQYFKRLPRSRRDRATLASLSQTRILTVAIAMVRNASEWWPSQYFKRRPRSRRGRATLASLSQTRILTVPIAMVWNTSEWWPSQCFQRLPRSRRDRATLASLSQTRILTVPIAMVWNTSEWWPLRYFKRLPRSRRDRATLASLSQTRILTVPIAMVRNACEWRPSQCFKRLPRSRRDRATLASLSRLAF